MTYPSDAHALRTQVCEEVSGWLAATGQILWVGAFIGKDPSTEAVALVTQTAGELGEVATSCYAERRYYAGAALVRQIVEAHYLLARFHDNEMAAHEWLGASQSKIERSFRPGQMRSAGGFRLNEYKTHCSLGGHPNPGARWLLPDHQTNIPLNLLIGDLAQHLSEIAELVQGCLTQRDEGRAVGSSISPLPAVIEHWRREDAWSSRITLPDPSSLDGK